MLEVAPGDKINIRYHDEKRLNEINPILNASLNAAYANGSITMAVELLAKGRNGEQQLNYYNVRRCRKGDTILVVVNDVDEDQSPKRDQIKVQVKTSGGEKLILTAIESGAEEAEENGDPIHTGVYRALLKLGDETKSTSIKLERGETVTASYLDRENLDPGVPVLRTVSVVEAGTGLPQLDIQPQRIVLARDESAQSQDAIEQLLRKAYNRGKTDLEIWTAAHGCD